jgi:putative restriction endonuclease
VKAVFALTEGSDYDDLPYARYHFPENSSNRIIAQEAIGDWIVYYKSGTGLSEAKGGRSYVACAKVTRVEPAADHPQGGYYARISDYTEFERPLSFRKGDEYFERRGIGNKTHWQRSLRRLNDAEFEDIVRSALAPLFDPAFERRYDIDDLDDEGRSLFYTGPGEVPRPLVEILSHKRFRDRNFRKNVRAAYRNKCAVTHFDLMNGGGRPEVQACHIRPVENGGPDVVQNGIALSGTIHWMFDRGLISFDDHRKLMISHNQMPSHLRSVLDARKDQPWFPPEPHLRPRADFMEWHRDVKFGNHEAAHA